MTTMNARRTNSNGKAARRHRGAVLYGQSAEGGPTRMPGRSLPTSIKGLPLPTPERGRRVLELMRDHIDS
jgi:hypothetical protein